MRASTGAANLRRVAAGLLFALLWGACPAENEVSSTPRSVSISGLPQVTQGTTVELPVIVNTLSGASSALIEVFGQVPGVTIEVVSPQFVSGSTQLVLTAARDAPAGQGGLTLQASFGSAGAVQSQLQVTVLSGQRVTANGRLTDAVGQPLGGQTVHLLRDGTSAVTDDDGRFAFSQVLIPYDLAVTGPARTWVWQDLRSPEPVLVDFARVVSSSEATLRGRVSGGLEGPLGPEVRTLVAVSSALPGLTAGDGPLTPAADGTAAFELAVGFPGAAAGEVAVLALQYTVDESGAPVAYHGAGRTRVRLEPGETATDVEVALLPIEETASVAGRLPVVAGLAAPLTLRLDRAGAPGATFRIGPIAVSTAADATVSAPFELRVPLLPGLQVGVETSLGSGAGQEAESQAGPLAPGTTGIDLTLAPYLSAAATLAPGAALGQAYAGPNVAWLRPVGRAPADPDLRDLVVLSTTLVRMPDLAALGLTWPTTEAEVALERVTAGGIPLVEPFHGPAAGSIHPGLRALGIVPPDPAVPRAERSTVTATLPLP